MNMNKIVNVSIIMLVMTSILGCNNNSDLKEAANQSQSGNAAPQKKFRSKSPEEGNHLIPQYIMFLESDPIIQTSYKQIVWKEGDVVLTATISKAEGEQALQSNTVISSITVESNNGVHTIELDKKSH
ncbi:hypothetical protein ACFSQ7_02245 [Paenibacillus rhizoplanae]